MHIWCIIDSLDTRGVKHIHSEFKHFGMFVQFVARKFPQAIEMKHCTSHKKHVLNISATQVDLVWPQPENGTKNNEDGSRMRRPHLPWHGHRLHVPMVAKGCQWLSLMMGFYYRAH